MIDIYEQMDIEEHAYDSGYESAKSQYEEKIAQLTAQRDELMKAMKDIQEYWNGSRNDSAMYDACQHSIEVAMAAIRKVEEKE